MTVRTITGNIKDLAGVSIPNATFSLLPQKYAFGSPAVNDTVFGDQVTVLADASGGVNFDLHEGNYIGRISTTQGVRTFTMVVDTEGPWTLGRLINDTIGIITPTLIQQAFDAAAQAVAIAGFLSGLNDAVRNYEYIATSGQTVFTGADINANTLLYRVGRAQVFRNGVRMNRTIDYTETNENTLTFAYPLTAGDRVNIDPLTFGGAAGEQGPPGNAPLYQSFALAALALPSIADGDVFFVRDLAYRKQTGATIIPELNNAVPHGKVYARHFAENTTPGTTNMRVALKAAVDFSRIVYIDQDTFVSGGALDAGTDWRHHIVVDTPTTIVFSGGRIITNTPFASRAVCFLVRSSDVKFVDSNFVDNNTGTNNWVIPIGGGRTYDSSFPDATLSRLRVVRGEFFNSWISVSIQFGTTSSGSMGFRDIKVIGASSYARPDNTSSGNFNFRSDGPWRVGDVKCIGCSAYNGRSASSYNYYGVDGGVISSCSSFHNTYAGTEMENGTQDIVISAFSSDDDMWGVWIDDSRRITVNGLTHKTTSEAMLNQNESLGTFHRTRPAVMLTRQGFAGHTDWVTTDIVIKGVVSEFGRIVSQTFGSSPAGAFGRIVIDGVTITSDGVARTTGNTQIQIGGTVPDLTLANVRVGGGTARNVELTIPDGGVHNVINLQTFVVGSETPVGLLTAGLGTLYLSNVRVRSDSLSNSGQRHRDYVVGGQPQPDRVGGVRQFWGFFGSPEGVYAANVGSVYYRADGGAGNSSYVKESGTGNTGWMAK